MDIDNIIKNNSIKQIKLNNINDLKLHQTEKGLTIFAMNIRSLNKNFDMFIAEIQTFNINIDILILTEIWGDGYKEKLKIISGYTQHTHTNKLNRSGGVLIFCKQELNFTLEDNHFKSADTIIGNLKINNKTIKIIAIYRSPSLPSNEFIEEFEKYLIKLHKDEICILGDININLLKPIERKTKDDLKYENISSQYGMDQLITLPTRGDSCLDHIIFKSKIFEPMISGTVKMSVTDHEGIFIIIKNEVQKKEATFTTFKKYNYKEIEKKFQNTCWKFILNETDTDICTKNLIEYIKKIKDEHVSVVKRFDNKDVKIKQPWITTEITKLIRERNKIKEIIIDHPFNPKILEIYKILRNKTTALIRLSKNRYYRKSIENSKDNSRQLWKAINNITHRNKRKTKTLPDKDDASTTANKMVKYFSSVGKENVEDDLTNFKLNSNKTEKDFTTNLISTEEVIEIAKNLKHTNSRGIDDIEIFFIKKFINYIAEPLKHVINCSFETGIFPECLKNTIIVPIHKQGDINEFSNYRPISITSNISKIFEIAFLNRLNDHLGQNNILNNEQYGFRKNIGTDEALAKLFEEIYNNINKGLKTVAIFIDLTKAFDKVNHKILLTKLQRYGIKDKTKRWCETYLKDRRICVRIGNQIGQYESINWGVPQGSILGPTLFLIYINDIYNIKLNGVILNYADDCVIINKARTIDKLSNESTNDIQKFNEWCHYNKLNINIKKTKYIYFTLKNQNVIFDIKIHKINCHGLKCKCENLERTNYIKYLGIYVDQNLKWNVHTDKLCSHLKKMCYYFYYIRNYLDTKTCLKVYFALVNSYINYGILIWGSTYDVHINRLHKIHKNILRIIFKNKYKNMKNKMLNIRQTNIMKILNYQKKHNVCVAVKKYNTRNRKTNTISPILEKYRQFYKYIYSKIVSHIPTDIFNIKDRKIFKTEVRKWIVNVGDFRKYIDEYKV